MNVCPFIILPATIIASCSGNRPSIIYHQHSFPILQISAKLRVGMILSGPLTFFLEAACVAVIDYHMLLALQLGFIWNHKLIILILKHAPLVRGVCLELQHGWMDGWIDGQTDRQTDRQTHTHTELGMSTWVLISWVRPRG